jgi:excisionase family DNA binding protein
MTLLFQVKSSVLTNYFCKFILISMNELTTKEVAEKLGISTRQVQTLIQQNKIVATKKGRDWFVLESDLELIKERKKTGRPKKEK